jgi:predicted phage terminase large subunit-like protein
MSWLVVYEKAIREDGSLFFPKKLTAAFLEGARRVMGSYIFANQYQNEIIPSDELIFRPEWIRYYKHIPENVRTFIFIDPAISLEKTSDYTAVAVVHVDSDNVWYVPFVRRYRISPTEIVDKVFELTKQFKPMHIGIEEVAFQKALLYMIDEKQKDTGTILPVTGIKPGNEESKEKRILGLVPRFEWGKIFFQQGLTELEDELAKFPRARHDDCLDALSMVERISVPPAKIRSPNDQPNPNDAQNYERWYREQLAKKGQSAHSRTDSEED